MGLEQINTDAAPAAIGPYSQGVKAGDFCYFSGQIPLDPVSMEIVGPGIEAQTEQVMANMKAALAGAGLSYANVVKTTLFLTDLNDFGVVNGIYGNRLDPHRPARATVQVAALPKGAKIEIEWVAYCG
ncbi:MAG: reactive intermediate/imine deaminase [Desulfuromonas sp.]|nr:MAG: reactive intermediate/imine deaminase [Desulfuromonas sp.]